MTRSRSQRNVPTIADVARHAGVSPMTVSRVINGEASVRDQTRDRVNASIAALNYAPSPAARQLAGGEDTKIALVYSNPSSAYLSEFLMGSLDRASSLNVQLMVEKFGEVISVPDMISHLRRGRISGIILPPPLCESEAMLAALADEGIPVVAVAPGMPKDGVASVCIDDFAAARAMTQHLIALGHKRIGFIKGNPDQSASERRYLGYLSALEEAGLLADPALIAQGLFTYRSGLEAAEKILSASPPPSALFASNDDMAAAAVAIAHARRLDVPGDLSICGFDDTPLATTIWPELTTIHQPISDMARSAVDMLVRMVRSKVAPAHEWQDFKLIQRQSDGAT